MQCHILNVTSRACITVCQRLVVFFSPLRFGLIPRLVYVGFVVDKFAVGNVTFCALILSPSLSFDQIFALISLTDDMNLAVGNDVKIYLQIFLQSMTTDITASLLSQKLVRVLRNMNAEWWALVCVILTHNWFVHKVTTVMIFSCVGTEHKHFCPCRNSNVAQRFSFVSTR
jgi:hypothetical protein